MKKLLLPILFVFLYSLSQAQTCDPDSLQTIITRASQTDPNISFELKQHYSYYNPTCVSRNTLLLHLGGSFGKPGNYQLFPELAGNNGFNVINLHYPNGTASKTACGSSTDTTCFVKFRKEILEGIDYSTTVSVDSNNCIYNRVIKLLKYLHANHPTQNWNSFYSGNTVNWNKVIVSGHSQGGGHAALIGVTKPLKRVIMFASPNDYNNTLNIAAPWTSSTKITADSLYYGFANLYDDVVNSSEQFRIWNNLGMPTYGDTTNVDGAMSPYSYSRQLYSQLVDLTNSEHSSMILDAETPIVAGVPVYEPVWKYLLGINNLVSISENEFGINFKIYPNPAQNQLFIDYKSNIDKLRIIGVSGIIIYSQKQYTNSIDVSDLKPGIYFLAIETGNKRSIQRFIKY